MLNVSPKTEKEFVENIVDCIPQNAVNDQPSQKLMLGKFPFLMVEAKNLNYSMNAVLQGLHYYGYSANSYTFIDNYPCFCYYS